MHFEQRLGASFWSLRGTRWECIGNIFGNHLRTLREHFGEQVESILGTFREHIGNLLRMLWECKSNWVHVFHNYYFTTFKYNILYYIIWTLYYTTYICLVLYCIIHTLYSAVSTDCIMSQCWTSWENTLDLYFPICPSLDNDYGTTRKAKLPWEH
jgi:hypothetical protein